MKLLQYTWKNSMLKIINSKMAVFVILMAVVSRSYVGVFSAVFGFSGLSFLLVCIPICNV